MLQQERNPHRRNGSGDLSTRWYDNMREIPGGQWDRLALPTDTPLLEWDWLRCLEDSGSIAPQEGWNPQHLTVWDGERLVGAAPLYVKMHSMGEFVFDFAWADVAHQLGAAYYPKLVGMSPVTPSNAFRFLIDTEYDRAEVSRILVERMLDFCEANGMGGLAFNFVDPEWMDELSDHDFVPWEHQSYQWRNKGFSSFDDYLAGFTKNQRRNIRRERRSMERQGIQIDVLTGEQLTPAILNLMYDFYAAHNAQFGPWAAKFLNRAFFQKLAESFQHRIALVAAYTSDTERSREHPTAMAFLLIKGDLVLGRYWGCEYDLPELHFNCCYYRPIEWAIENGYQRFDPGMGSSHKVRRGFDAVPSYSLHHFFDERMQYVMHRNIDRINSMEATHIEQLNAARPVHDNPYRGGVR